MARYSDNRELNREMKSLYKTWAKVDSRIELPPNLTGNALLSLIEDLPAPKAPAKEERRRIQFSPRVFSWKSASTYAAALVLIVALSALLSRGPSSITQGDIVPTDPDSGGYEDVNPLDPRGHTPDQPQAGEEQPAAGSGVNPAETQSQPADTQPAVDETDPVQETGPRNSEGDVVTFSDDDPDAWLGGTGESTILQEDDKLRYSWRANDMTLPGKEDFPLVVNVVDIATGGFVYSFDVSAIQAVTQSFLYGGKLALVGTSVADSTEEILLVYDVSQAGQANSVLEHSMPGKLLDARIYRNVVNMITYAPAGSDPGGDITELPNSTGEDLCVIAAVDLDTAQVEQKAFAGASEKVSLYNLNAYLDYEGDATDESPEGHHVAHIRLDGLNIELRGEE